MAQTYNTSTLEDYEFKASLSYVARLVLKTNQIKKN
jgi:hypothetical protein